MALMKLCNCGKKIQIADKRCGKCQETHARNELKRKREGYRKYNERRNSKLKNFYGSKAWKRVREAVINRDNGLCLVCKYNYKYNYIKCVHHITPLRENQDLALDINNLISVCEDCHETIHELYNTNSKHNIQKELSLILEALGDPGGAKK